MNPVNTPSSVTEPRLSTTRVHFDNVLVAVDLSPASTHTLKIAADLARRYGSRLIVAHVVSSALLLPAETETTVKETINLWLKPYLTSEMQCSIVVAEGGVVGEIIRVAKENQADLLVIGTHAAKGAEKLAFGSTAESLFRSIGIPVLTVGPHVRRFGERFASILLPTDLEPHAFRAAQYAVSLAEESAATLTLLHVRNKADAADSFQSAGLRMEQLVPADAALWCDPVFRTAVGDPADVILATARQVEADLIVLGVTHARPLADHANWSIASKIVREAGCPVLTVRDHL